MSEPDVSHADLAKRLDRGDNKFDQMDARFDEIEDKLDRMNELLDAWVAVKGTGNFLIWWGKVVSGVMVILAASLAILKFKLLSLFGGGV